MADDYADPTKLSPGSNYGFVPFEQTRDARQMGETRAPTYQDVEASIRADPNSKFSVRQTQLTQDLSANNQLRYQATNPAQGAAPNPDAYLDVGSTTILDHNEALARELPAVYTTQSNGMRGMANTYSALANGIQSHTDTLAGTWDSDSAKPQFLSWVGKSTYSLREWAAAAGDNATVLSNLATAVSTAKDEMATLMAQFEAESKIAREAATAAAGIPDLGVHAPEGYQFGVAIAARQAKEGQSAQWGGFFDTALAGGNPQAQVLEKYTQLSRSGPMTTIENGFALARQGIRVDGPVWRGPIDATQPPAYTGGGGMPGVPGPGAPSGPRMPSIPGAGVPGAGVPGAGTPGARVPSAAVPGAAVPGAPGGQPTPSVPPGVTSALNDLQRGGPGGLGSYLPMPGTTAAHPSQAAQQAAAAAAARQAELQSQLAAQQQAAAQQAAALQGSLDSAQGLQGALGAPIVSPALLAGLSSANGLLGSAQAGRGGAAAPSSPGIPPGLSPGAVPSASAPGQAAPGIPPGLAPGGVPSVPSVSGPGQTVPGVPPGLSGPLRPGMPGMPQVPGTAMPPGAGAPPMGRTALPGRNVPAMPRTPTVTAPGIPGRTVPGVPAVPGVPGTGTAPPLAGRGNPPRMPGVPALPGQPGAGGTGPGAPGQPRFGQPQVPGVPGTGRPGGPGQPRFGQPQVPGVPGTGRPGGPGAPGSGAPQMPGTPAAGATGPRPPGMAGLPPAQGMPRSLAGRNLDGIRNLVRAPGRLPGSFVVPEGPSSAVPTSSGLGGRGSARAGRPENLERVRAATRRGLQGRMLNDTEAGRLARNALRSAGPTMTPPGSPRRRQDEDEQPLKKIGQIDNHELFDVEAAGDGVIDRTAAPQPVKSGPALGAG